MCYFLSRLVEPCLFFGVDFLLRKPKKDMVIAMKPSRIRVSMAMTVMSGLDACAADGRQAKAENDSDCEEARSLRLDR